MDELRLIENELVPVYETDAGQRIVYGKDLHKSLSVRTDFSTWVKRRLNECDAQEKNDYELLPIIEEQASGAKHTIEYVIELDTAKEMAMLERNEIGKRVRQYFIEVDNRHRQQAIDRNSLSPELQMFIKMGEVMARQELEQKRQAVEIENIKESQQVITETFQKQPEDDFKTWVNKCVGKMAESSKYPFRGSDKDKYKQIRYESYERLNKKKPCRLNQRVEAEKGRAFSAGASTTKISAINKLTIIEGDKALKPIYETVIKEMMIAYCVK